MTVLIDYRMPPAYLATASIVAELMWLDDAVSWRGCVGDYARRRAAALRDELQRREWMVST